MKHALFCCFLHLAAATALAQQAPKITGLQLLYAEDIRYQPATFVPADAFIKALVQGPGGYRYVAVMEKDMVTDHIVKLNHQGDSLVLVENTSLPGGPHITAPTVLALDKEGNLYYFNSGAEGPGIRRLSPGGQNTFHLATSASGAGGMAFDEEGNIFTTSFWEGTLYKIDPQGTQTLFYNALTHPAGLAFDQEGNLFLLNNLGADASEILKIDPQGNSTVFARFEATDARYLHFDAAGNLLMSGTNNHKVYSITPAGEVRVLRENAGFVSGAALDERSNLVLAVMEGTGPANGIYTLERILKISENLPAATQLAQLTATAAGGSPLSYNLVSGNESGGYGIDAQSGQLYVANAAALDFETNPVQSLLLQVSDGQAVATERLIIQLLDQQVPEVVTTEVTAVGKTSAQVDGEVVAGQSVAVLERGIVYGTSVMPDVEDAKIPAGEGEGAFGAALEDLLPQTTYYVRAYARNAEGIGYGQERSFTTQAADAVEALNVTASLVDQEVHIRWLTTAVYPELLFELERSHEDAAFVRIAEIRRASPTAETQDFLYIDFTPLQGKVVYRVKIQQANGSATVSEAVAPQPLGLFSPMGNSQTPVSAWPHPVVANRVNLASSSFQPFEAMQARVYTASGVVVAELKGQVSAEGTLQLQLPAGLKKGLYVFQLEGKKGLFSLPLILHP